MYIFAKAHRYFKKKVENCPFLDRKHSQKTKGLTRGTKQKCDKRIFERRKRRGIRKVVVSE